MLSLQILILTAAFGSTPVASVGAGNALTLPAQRHLVRVETGGGRPATYLIAVPRIWNRIYDGLHKQIAAKPPLLQKLFHHGLRAATKKAEGRPLAVHERLALTAAEKLIFSKVRAKLGGRLRYAISGAGVSAAGPGAVVSPVAGSAAEVPPLRARQALRSNSCHRGRLRCGTWSTPPSDHGLHRRMRQAVSAVPLIAPCRSMAV